MHAPPNCIARVSCSQTACVQGTLLAASTVLVLLACRKSVFISLGMAWLVMYCILGTLVVVEAGAIHCQAVKRFNGAQLACNILPGLCAGFASTIYLICLGIHCHDVHVCAR